MNVFLADILFKNVIFHGNCHFVTGLLLFPDNFFTIVAENTKGGGYTKKKGSSWRHQKLLTKIQIKKQSPKGAVFPYGRYSPFPCHNSDS